MSYEYKFKDSASPLTLHVNDDDIHGAVRRSLRKCVLSRCVQREHNWWDIQVFRTVAYTRKREDSIPIRYQVPKATLHALIAWDAAGRAHPIILTFTPIRKALTRRYQADPKRRKAKAKAARAKYALEKKLPRLKGMRRAYTKIDPLTLLGVRNGRGIRPMGMPGAKL